jgi:glycosyltransferase involved in cell wall biosynthesis
MKTALQVISTGGMYGAERVLLELALHLRDMGWQSKVLAIDGAGAWPLVAAASAHGLSAHVLSAPGDSWFAQLRKLRAFLASEAIDCVHSHGYKPSIMLHLLGEPRRRACIATCHSWYSVNWRLKAYEWLDKRAMRAFPRVVAVSSEIQADLLASGVPSSVVSYIPNGLDLEQPHPDARRTVREELGLDQAETLVLRVGRLAVSKGNAVLLEALAAVRTAEPWRLALLGDGEEHDSLQRLAHELGIASKVTFLGFKANVADYLAAADVFAIPSLQEGLPMVLLEAMAAGCPCVVTDVGAIGSVIENGVSGMLVRPGNVQELSAAMQQLCDSHETRARYAAAANSRYRRNFSRAAMGRKYGEHYDALYELGRRSVGRSI